MDKRPKKIAVWTPPGPDEEEPRPAPRGRGAVRRTPPAPSARFEPQHFDNPSIERAFTRARGRHIVAEGDSWFHFPIIGRVDLLEALDELGRKTSSIAYRGDTLENMVYGTSGAGGTAAGSDLDRLIRMIREIDPPAVLLSAGGNDVAGNEFRAFLNHKASGLPAIREAFLKEYVHGYVKRAYERVVGRIREVAPKTPIVVHGYAYARPTGIGIGNVFGWNFIGPWLKPSFDATGHTFDEGSKLVARVIDAFNDMLATLAAEQTAFVHVDLRKTVGLSVDDWSDELHLHNTPVRRAARAIDRALKKAIGE